MNHHSFSCQGESHKYSDKPCQDSSYSYSGNGISIAIVCDGHGGERYFRSDIGSQICIKVTENAIRTFVNSIDKNMFKDKPFTQKRCLNDLVMLIQICYYVVTKVTTFNDFNQS